MNWLRRFAFISIMAAISVVIIAGIILADTSADCEVSGFGGRQDGETGTETWWFTIPDEDDVISWSSGENYADLHPYTTNWYGPEYMFNMPAVTGRTFTGFSDVDGPGLAGSYALTQGMGSSVGPPFAQIWWSLDAFGALGSGTLPSYSSQCTIYDPWCIKSDDLERFGVLGESSYDLILGVGISSADISEKGYFGFTVYYDDAFSTTVLLDISIDSIDINVTNDLPAGLIINQITGLSQIPVDEAFNEVTINDIYTLVYDDITPDRDFDTPLYFQIIWDNIPVPTVDMGDGSFAKIRVENTIGDFNDSFGSGNKVPLLDYFGLIILILLLAISGYLFYRANIN